MTLESALIWSTVRAVCVASIALPLAWAISKTCFRFEVASKQSRIVIAVALLPLFVPDLLIGFTYRLTSARLIHSVIATEFLYAALLLARIVAFQFAVHMVLPSGSGSREAIHLWKLREGRNIRWWMTWLKLQFAGPTRTLIVAWMAGVMLCFQEFETAALLQIDRHPIAWTVWMFDAHAAGEPLIRSLGFAVPAIVIQSVWLVPCLWLLMNGPALQTGMQPRQLQSGPSVRIATVITLAVIAASFAAVCVWPVIGNGREAMSGLQTFLRQQTILPKCRQIVTSLGECAIAAVIGLQICVLAQRTNRRAWQLCLLLPGLCGSLILSLCLLALFQLPLLHIAYDTWLPMLIGHVLLLLPRAFLLVTILKLLTPAASQHSVELLATAKHSQAARSVGQLAWILQQRKWLLSLAILTHWCFWDVTVAATLRPVRFEPIITRLYNEMHYGRTETLAAMTVLALLIPIGCFLTVGGIWKQITLFQASRRVIE